MTKVFCFFFSKKKFFPSLLAILSAAVSVVFLLIRAFHGLWFRSWGDELEHLLGGRALMSGDLLYVSFVDLHGPFIFFLAKIYGELCGWSNGNFIRLVPAAFLLLPVVAIGATKGLVDTRQRAWAVTVFAGLSATVWIVQGLYLFDYYLISGALLAIVLACTAVPCWQGLIVSRRAAALGGVCATLAVFTSHAWLPTACAFFLSTLVQSRGRTGRTEAAGAFIVSAAVTTAMCVGWLWMFGSIRGYIVFHIIFAHTVYLQTVQAVNPELTVAQFCLSLVPSFSPDRIVQSLADSALLLSVMIGWRVYRRLPLALGVLGILAADARGNVGFQDGTFLILSFALFAATLARALQRARRPLLGTCLCLSLVTGAELAARHAVSSPNALTRKMIVHDQPVRITAPSEAAEFALIRRIVKPDERMLALVYRPRDYWLAGRLPMKGFYEYLPDDALYARHPALGVRRDLCEAMRREPPPVVIFDNWTVWDRYAPANYMPCLIEKLTADYVRSPVDRFLFVRRDRVPADFSK